MGTIEIRKADIVRVSADAIVNAANSGLWEGGGVCGAIFAAAGSDQLRRACEAIGHCDTGSAVITPAFRLNAKYIIHAVGPRYTDGKHGEGHLLSSAYQKALALAEEHDCHSIAFPLLSAGIFGYPLEEAWEVALSACRDFLNTHPESDMHVIFTVLDDRIMAAGKRKALENEIYLLDDDYDRFTVGKIELLN